MIVRNATPADVPEIIDIWNAEIQSGFATFTTEAKTTDALIARLQTPWPFLVAEASGQVAGFACVGKFRDGPGYKYTAESTIYLAPEAQGLGGGRLLMQELEARLRAQSIHTLIAAISGENPDALGFHRSMGFENGGILPQAGRKHKNWLDLHLLFKHL